MAVIWQIQAALAERLHTLANPRLDIVLGHFLVLVGQQLLRMRQVAGVRRGLGSDIPKLKIHLCQRAGLVKA